MQYQIQFTASQTNHDMGDDAAQSFTTLAKAEQYAAELTEALRELVRDWSSDAGREPNYDDIRVEIVRQVFVDGVEVEDQDDQDIILALIAAAERAHPAVRWNSCHSAGGEGRARGWRLLICPRGTWEPVALARLESEAMFQFFHAQGLEYPCKVSRRLGSMQERQAREVAARNALLPVRQAAFQAARAVDELRRQLEIAESRLLDARRLQSEMEDRLAARLAAIAASSWSLPAM
ncbi:hypothetical protein [Chromobacterium subtsugae]|uniref:hypothetical protein n=1 Tax=Chromobacterium subtsugae TaxID=251747 RepID=UPI000640C394|nr:hypothetical protein [Chromobacterium subtsugae]OBU84529.1 hypothetical protein MY55_21500 [Chromobacterium subtsugae]